jgi:hypothetical protein
MKEFDPEKTVETMSYQIDATLNKISTQTDN